MDFNALSNRYFEEGEGAKVYEWLQTHGSEYGFGQPYTLKDSLRPVGYEEEKWHWSYMPLSQKYQESYRALVTKEDIKDFKGAEAAQAFDAIEEYVFGIDPACL